MIKDLGGEAVTQYSWLPVSNTLTIAVVVWLRWSIWSV